MKIIFLDVDGVLNNSEWAKRMIDEGVRVYAEDMLEDRAILLLKQIIDATGADVVVSSTWRDDPKAMEHLLVQLAAYDIWPIGSTPRTNLRRGDDISQWLERYDGYIESYVILDDDSDMTVHMDHLVKTSFEHGLRHEHVERAIEILAADMLSEIPLRCANCTWYGDYKCEMPHRDVDVKPDDYCSMGAWHSV